MDDIVLRGMAKWPNVPAVYGWLSLNRRGQWLIKGDPITNPAVTAFIGRNYERDPGGSWFFQNGPQRVFVTLEYTPFVYRVLPEGDGFQATGGFGEAELCDAGAVEVFNGIAELRAAIGRLPAIGRVPAGTAAHGG